MQRKSLTVVAILCCALLLAVSLAGCSSGNSGGEGPAAATSTPPATASTAATMGASGQTIPQGMVPAAARIVMQNGTFTPSTVTVHKGDVIAFLNRDKVVHDVSINGHFVGAQTPGTVKPWPATTVGTFKATDPFNKKMTLTIIVQ